MGRAYNSTVVQHLGGFSESLDVALQWWEALLLLPVFRVLRLGACRTRVCLWTDGSRETDRPAGRLGAVGFFALSSVTSGIHGSAFVPEFLEEELLSVGKDQRNTQVELLGVLVALLSAPEFFRGVRLELFIDNSAALSNILAGGAAEPQSRHLVAVIWLLLAVRQVDC